MESNLLDNLLIGFVFAIYILFLPFTIFIGCILIIYYKIKGESFEDFLDLL